MRSKKTTFALCFGNRGFFPASLIDGARRDLPGVLKELGHDSLMLDKKATRHGAIETPREGQVYAEFLRRNRGKFGGVILSLPNFGDETGAVAALKDCGVPILVQAYPDELDKMAPSLRRDAFCGKISVMDVFCQSNVKFTVLKPHTVSPLSEEFKANLEHFDRVCRVVNGLKGLVVGAVGARTTPFKTVRFDEIALQKADITVETFDLCQVFDRMKKTAASGRAYKAKAAVLRDYSCWEKVPKAAFDNLVRLGVVLDELIAEYQLDAVAVRCWTEMQSMLGISPCVVMSELNNRGAASACEVDVCNAVTMQALALASGGAPACLDWNNNYADDEEKCILFHCGPVPADLMQAKGTISDHLIIANAIGKGRGFGCNTGRIAPGDCTFGSMITEAGHLKFYLGQGRFTNDPIPPEFFGCAGVAEIEALQEVLLHIGRNGYRHHVSVAGGHILAPVREALAHYLGFQVAVPQESQ